MKRVNIYIATDSANTRNSKKSYGYVLECIIQGETKTREGFGQMEGTYNKVVLAAANEALKRMKRPSEIHICCENGFVVNMIKTSLENWSKNGFVTSKGEPIKNQEEWKEFCELSKKHLIIAEEGKNEYSTWIKEEVKKREEYKCNQNYQS